MPKYYYILPLAMPSNDALKQSGDILKPDDNKDFLKALRGLRETYHKETKISSSTLSSSPSSIKMFFGYEKNTPVRHPQIEFLEALLAHFEEKNKDKAYTREDLCILVAAVQFIRHKINGEGKVVNHSVLYKLLGDALALSKDNVMDSHTKYCLYQITNAFMRPDKTKHADSVSEEYTRIFSKTSVDCKALSEVFTSHVAKQKKQTPKPTDEVIKQNTYPITIALSKVVGDCAAVAGWSAGAVAGDFLAKTTGAMPVKAALTAGIGSAVCLLTGAGPTVAIALAAPTVASKILTTFSSVSMAYVLGGVMKILGNAAGAAAGLPLDLSVHLAYSGANKMYEVMTGKQLANVSGMRLVDGHEMLCGIEFTIIDDTVSESAHPSSPLETISLHEQDGLLDVKVNGKTVPDPFVRELQEKLQELHEAKTREEALELEVCSPVGSC